MVYATNSIIVLLILAIRCDTFEVLAKPSINQDQIIENIRLLSQNDDIASQPSRLRSLLVNDLSNVLRKSTFEKTDCLAEANIKVDTLNCECRRFTCSDRRFALNTKRSRFLIARSCEDICCRKRILSKKSPPIGGDTYVSDNRQCEVANATNKHQIKSIVQIFSTNSKKFICLGSLVHPKAVLITLECVTARMNDVLFVKMKETVDTYQNLYQVRNVTEIILPDNYMDRVERLRFNMALLILNKEMEMNYQIGISCLPKLQESVQSLANRKCFLSSLEYVNGRLRERNESIHIFEVERCRDIFNHQNRLQIYFPKQNICAGLLNGQSIHIESNGASLFCVHRLNDKDASQVYVLYGLLAWINDPLNRSYIDSPHLFTNINNYRYWFEKKLKKYTQ